MPSRQFSIFANYSQVAVFTAGIETPFNDWEPQHVAQGFAWREGSVSFATLEEAGTLNIEAIVAATWHPQAVAERVIRVPFIVTSNSVEIASITDGAVFELGRLGSCSLIFETWIGEGGEMQARFTFAPQESVVQPAILKADGNLHPPAELRMTARPA